MCAAQAHPQCDHRTLQTTARQDLDEQQSANQVRHVPAVQLTLSPFQIKDPFACDFLGDYQSLASKAAGEEKELKRAPDKTFLTEGIRNGFRITGAGSQVQMVQQRQQQQKENNNKNNNNKNGYRATEQAQKSKLKLSKATTSLQAKSQLSLAQLGHPW